MLPKEFLQRFAADVTKRCGICQATVEQVLPAVFDEIRYRLVDGRYPCIPIESFGTFGVIEKPERQYKVRGREEWKTLPPKKSLKFYMARSFRNELEGGEYNPSRKSFTRHPQDRPITRRKNMMYRQDRAWIVQKSKGRVIDLPKPTSQPKGQVPDVIKNLST